MVLCDCCSISNLVYGLGLFVIAKTLIPIILSFVKKNKEPELNEKDWKKDVVYLFQFKGNSTLSSLSPFCVKVEAFLRLNNIPYERRYSLSVRGKNGKLPLVELNGEQIADSQIILMRLAQKYNIKDYDTTEKAGMGRAVERMVANHTFFHITYFKFQHPGPLLKMMMEGVVPDFLAGLAIPVVKLLFAGRVKKGIEGAVGQFTEDEHKELIRDDFTALKNILGDKKFLMGDKATAADCILFGHLSALYYLAPGTKYYPSELIDSAEYSTLKQWLERMKDTAFGNEFHT